MDKEKRFKYLYRLQEKLRLYHNLKGTQARNGVITMEEFRYFQNGWIKDRNKLICKHINKCKDSLTEEEKEKLLDKTHEDSWSGVKDKEKYKKNNNTIADISDIENE